MLRPPPHSSSPNQTYVTIERQKKRKQVAKRRNWPIYGEGGTAEIQLKHKTLEIATITVFHDVREGFHLFTSVNTTPRDVVFWAHAYQFTSFSKSRLLAQIWIWYLKDTVGWYSSCCSLLSTRHLAKAATLLTWLIHENSPTQMFARLLFN